MKETKSRKSLFKRVPMAKDLLLGELIYFILGEIILGVIWILSKESMISQMCGFFEGFILALFIMIHMTLSVEDSVTMYEEEALKHTRKNYIIRMIVLVAAFLVIIFFGLGNIIAALFGLMSLKVSAYIQPFTHKFTQNN